MILPDASEIARGLSRWAVYVGLALVVGVVTGALLARGCAPAGDDVWSDAAAAQLDRIEQRLVAIAEAQQIAQAVTSDRVEAEDTELRQMSIDGDELDERIEDAWREVRQ